MWTRFISQDRDQVASSCKHTNEPSGCIRSWDFDQLLAPQGLHTMELVSLLFCFLCPVSCNSGDKANLHVFENKLTYKTLCKY